MVKGLLPCVRARQWLSPHEISMILVILRSSMNLGLREVVSEEPHPKHEPQPHANTYIKKNKFPFIISLFVFIFYPFKYNNWTKYIWLRTRLAVVKVLLLCSFKIKASHKENIAKISWPTMLHLTCPAEVRARDDWLPAHTFLMMNPCRASITLGRYTRLVSPWPSLPARVSHVRVPALAHNSSRHFC